MGMVIRILIVELVALGSIKMLGIGFNSYLRKLCLFGNCLSVKEVNGVSVKEVNGVSVKEVNGVY